MVLPGTEALTPCLMGGCSAETRKIWKERYRYGKKYGVRTLFAELLLVCIRLYVKPQQMV